MSLEDLEKQLYERREGEPENNVVDLTKKEAEAEASRAEDNSAKADFVKSEWRLTDPPPSGTARAPKGDSAVLNKLGIASKIFFWVTLPAVLIALGLGVFYLLQYFKTKDAGFEIKAPQKVLIGQPFMVSFKLENKSEDLFRQAKISFRLPEGAVGLERHWGKQIVEEDLGDLGPGQSGLKEIKMVVLAPDKPLNRFETQYSYLPPNLNTRFEKKETVEILADQPAINLSLNAPEKIFSGEEFEINVSYKNLADLDYQNVRLEIEYPNSFKFKGASSTPTSGNNVWVGNLLRGDQNSLTVKGSAVAPDDSFMDIKGKIYLTFNGQDYLIAEKNSNLSISASPLSLGILVNNSLNYFASLNDNLNYQISYKNNTDVALQDAVVKIKFAGEMYDFKSLNSGGFLDSVNNTVTWSAANTPELKSLAPGVEGRLAFSIKTKSIYPIKRLFDKNFTLKVSGEINSPTVPYNISSDKTVGLANLETKVLGRVEAFVSADHGRKGPYPPKADKTTNYTVKIAVKNYATDVKDVEIKAILQSGATWTGAVKSGIEQAPEYNPRTGEVIWTIPKITATKGVIGVPIETTFEIEITPSVTQINQSLPILSPVTLSATDEFTGAKLNSASEAIKTIDPVQP